MDIQYTNFDLKLDNYDFADGSAEKFTINVTHQWGQLEGGAVPVALDTSMRMRVFTLDRGELGANDIDKFGRELGKYLFAGKVRDELEVCARRCKQDDADEPSVKHRLRIRLWISHPPLASLPWEFAYVERTSSVQEGYVALNELFSLVRFETLGQPIVSLSPADPAHLRMVAVFSNPEHSEALPGIANEQAKIEKGIPAYWPKIELNIVPGKGARATPGALAAAINGDTHLFHYSGHGEFVKSGLGGTGMPSAGFGELVLDKGDGSIHGFPAKQLANLLQGANVRLAFLNACNVGKRDSTNYFTGIAPALQDAGIPAVIGMQFKVLDDNAAMFSDVFYQTLSKTGSIDRAVLQARQQVYFNNQTATDARPHRDWGTPVLYLRAEGERLFPVVGEAVPNASSTSTITPIKQNTTQTIKPISAAITVPDPADLRRAMVKAFKPKELDVLCSDITDLLHVAEIQEDLDMSLAGEGGGLESQVLDLINYCKRRGWLAYLVQAVRASRPGII